jgi:hypothetical protein
MATVSTTLPADGQTIEAADVNIPINAILSEFNGNIDDNNIKTGANINGAKIAAGTLPGTALDTTIAGGWISGLTAPTSVVNNGNRSYTNTYASSIAAFTSVGMRKRFTRTVTAPTQCADLEASSSQYFNDTSLTGMTFTDDFVVSAWIKVESYPTNACIASRYNATSGWIFDLNSSGQPQLTGFNAGGANFSRVIAYQSIPLNKWVHVTAQLDMSTFTATTTTSYIMIDGVDVPASVTRGGTNPTALIQAGNLEIGAYNGGAAGTFFDGKLAQVAIFSAKVTQATMRGYMSQGLSGSETNLISAYSLSNSLNDLNTGNANNLTAQGGALATNADSPFADASNTSSSYTDGTTEFGIVTSVSTDGLTETIQVPEGCALPTSGGISAVAYSTQDTPYGFPKAKERWRVKLISKAQSSSAATTTFANTGSLRLTIPIGDYDVSYSGMIQKNPSAATSSLVFATLSTGAATESDGEFTSKVEHTGTSANVNSNGGMVQRTKGLTLTAATDYFYNVRSDVAAGTIYVRGDDLPTVITAELALL